MTRSERIQKLSNAIKAYRGLTATPPGAVKVVWKYKPQINRRQDIVRHLLALDRSHEQIELDAKAIDAFQTVEQFQKWIRSLEVSSALEKAIAAERAAE
jgi:translation initiation factor 2 alpha subunit (eIF-2alpha)